MRLLTVIFILICSFCPGQITFNLVTYSNNIGYGPSVMSSITSSASANCAVGYRVMENLTVGTNNFGAGADCMRGCTSCEYNIGNGTGTLAYNQTGSRNTCIGYGACGNGTNISNNTGIGFFSLINSYGSSNVAFGYKSGFYGSWSNSFWVDNQDRTDSATQMASSLIYGVFSSTVANQRLRFNSQLGINTTSSEKLTVAGRLRSTNSDIVVEDNTRGFILKDTQTTPHYWRITINNTGVLQTTDLGTTLPSE